MSTLLYFLMKTNFFERWVNFNYTKFDQVFAEHYTCLSIRR